MATLLERAIGAAKLDPAAYEDVEADAGALGQAMAVVAIASIATGIGTAIGAPGEGPGLVGGVIGAFVGWFIWAITMWLVGTKVLPEPETKADLGELLRTTGFAAAPGVVGLLGAIPLLGGLALLAAALWQIAAMVVAVRQALDYTSTGRAVAVCVIGFVAQALVVGLLLFVVFGSIFALAGGAPGPATIAP
jgi:hypothetical protein